ncbi:hypothetical protein D3OALGA1CA_1340 [Olavius algarvensis associated proteobacterium Delta 3]|nr:hypothetical protein D3OALGA1CA_1340 [Olavius algarvensis associated proteobacterium Delta 3]CAB5124562.1 hypothetical protein D3OALGB2SA_3197 [Olavius algarvensis associated proteobacterium Delta 3]
MTCILAVDDDHIDLELIRRSFKSEEYSLFSAQNGEEALEKARAIQPDLVILDIMIPGMDGYETCRRLKTDPDIDSVMVLLLSGRGSVEDRLKGYQVHADDYMIKPFDLKELKAKAGTLLRLKQGQDELKSINRRLEAVINAKTRELVEKEREAIFGQLVQGIVHNLKGPLSVVLMKADLSAHCAQDILNAEQDVTDPQRLIIEKILSHQANVMEAVGKIEQLIENLLEKGRFESVDERQDIDLNDLIEREMAFLEADLEFKHDVEKRIDMDPGLPTIKGVYADFSQVVYNMVHNALEAMHEGPDKKLHIRTRFDDSSVNIDFTDSGVGIAPEDLDRIFDPHFTTKAGKFSSDRRNSGGTGLGLFICTRLMETYGATISVKSVPGEGATFTVSIPRDPVKL